MADLVSDLIEGNIIINVTALWHYNVFYNVDSYTNGQGVKPQRLATNSCHTHTDSGSPCERCPWRHLTTSRGLQLDDSAYGVSKCTWRRARKHSAIALLLGCALRLTQSLVEGGGGGEREGNKGGGSTGKL